MSRRKPGASEDEGHGEDQKEQAHGRFNDQSRLESLRASHDFLPGIPSAAVSLWPSFCCLQHLKPPPVQLD